MCHRFSLSSSCVIYLRLPPRKTGHLPALPPAPYPYPTINMCHRPYATVLSTRPNPWRTIGYPASHGPATPDRIALEHPACTPLTPPPITFLHRIPTTVSISGSLRSVEGRCIVGHTFAGPYVDARHQCWPCSSSLWWIRSCRWPPREGRATAPTFDLQHHHINAETK